LGDVGVNDVIVVGFDGSHDVRDPVLEGGIVAGDVTFSAAKFEVDADGDGEADAQAQIGPIIRGTALRDRLPLISFTAYTHQAAFAQLANAFKGRGLCQRNDPLPEQRALTRDGWPSAP
jgi:predicted lipoprotein